MPEAQRNSLSFDRLLTHTYRHLGIIDEGTLDPGSRRLLDVVIVLQAFLREFTGNSELN